MLSIPGNARLFLFQYLINMHKSFEGLSTEIEKSFPGELLSGAFFIFLNRRRDSMKVLVWDHDGFVIFYKRLERGTFSRRTAESNMMNRRTFLMLLEGIEPKRLQRRFCL